MGKKCIPGVMCFENMTLFILIFISLVILSLYFQHRQYVDNIMKPPGNLSSYVPANISSSIPSKPISYVSTGSTVISVPAPTLNLATNIIPVQSNSIHDPYVPPMKTSDLYLPADVPVVVQSSGVSAVPGVGVPINVRTRGISANYTQVGILTRANGSEMILPLMGRRSVTNRNWQYYTMTTTGNMNTKLPVSVNGRSCTSEYGCDEISNGDVVYVEGYNDVFKATIYENSLFNYLPF